MQVADRRLKVRSHRTRCVALRCVALRCVAASHGATTHCKNASGVNEPLAGYIAALADNRRSHSLDLILFSCSASTPFTMPVGLPNRQL